MNMKHNVVLYGQCLFNGQHPALDRQQLKAIQSSGFTTLALWTLHVKPNGDLFYNESPLVSQGAFHPSRSHLPPLLSQLKREGSVRKVVFSLGSSGSADCVNLRNLLDSAGGSKTLSDNFAALRKALAVDGIDLALEEFPLSDYFETFVKLTLLLHREHGMEVSYSPYSMHQFWLGVLAEVRRKNQGRQIVSQFNLRCYAGGEDNDPGFWASQIDAQHGIENPSGFIIPVYWCRHGMRGEKGLPPSAIRNKFAELTQRHPGFDGGAIWNSDDIFTHETTIYDTDGHATARAYAQAVISGLGQQP